MPAEPRVFPVGRLDMDTEGLLILTNDGALTQLLTHPVLRGREGVPGRGGGGARRPGDVRRLRQGVELDDGPTAPARVAVVAPALLRLVIHEGRNRQVRRMCEAVGPPGGPPGPHPDRAAQPTPPSARGRTGPSPSTRSGRWPPRPAR